MKDVVMVEFFNSLFPGLGFFVEAMWRLFVFFFVLPIQLLVRLFSTTQVATSPKQAESDQGENARQAGCQRVVLAFANHLGFIAREVITRIEIEQLIDSGISPDELEKEIHARIEAEPGIILGTHTNYNHYIKLPYSLRDKHMYICGRTGSGKSNFIRSIINQDIANGCGVGVIAPEAEMLTEEIMPYIDDSRIDDVVYVNPADTDYPIPFNPLQLEEGEVLIFVLMTI